MSFRCMGIGIGLAALVLSLPAVALELGDDAPPLKVEKWVKGGPVDLKAGKGKTVYVVEFWATWCGPCRESIPHLTKLQKKYQDKVTIIGVSVDNEDAKRNTRKNVEPFVKSMGDRMAYAIALDTKDGDADKAFMAPFKVEGIPNAFVIDTKGKLVWQGHPKLGLDEVLAAVLAGKYDPKSLAAISKKIEDENDKLLELLDEYLKAVSGEGDPKKAPELGEKLFAKGKDDAGLMNQFAWTILTDEDVKTRDLKLALKAAQAANEATEGLDPAVLDTLARAQFDNGQVKEAVETQRKAVKAAGDNERVRQELEKALKVYEAADKK